MKFHDKSLTHIEEEKKQKQKPKGESIEKNSMAYVLCATVASLLINKASETGSPADAFSHLHLCKSRRRNRRKHINQLVYKTTQYETRLVSTERESDLVSLGPCNHIIKRWFCIKSIQDRPFDCIKFYHLVQAIINLDQNV
ncbi:hypothetical protein ACJIZ3_022140 [Penstemon smallii]|uniref:Uncharacterized protein n=1 Tax=Penstemon smallii TaxID=265156 RepID=A0ABD3SP23_9LAMI